MKVREVMGKPVVIIPEATVKEAAQIMCEKDITTLFVVEGQKVIGIITDMDIIKRAVICDKLAKDIKAKEIMTSNLIKIEDDENVEFAVRVMQKNKIRRLPVVSKGKFVGIITTDYISNHAAELGVDSLF